MLLRGDRSLLAAAIRDCCPEKLHVFAQAIGEFVTLDQLAESTRIITLGDVGVVRVDDSSQIEAVMSRWDAEALVFFFADDNVARQVARTVRESESAWWKLRKGHYDAPYTHQLTLVDPFCFYSATRSALEFVGGKRAILACFERVRQYA